MQIGYVLVASGSVITTRINHVVFQDDLDRAKSEAAKVAATLSKAGYFNFDLYDVNGETHVHVASFTVETPEPVVTIVK
jgi:hypothetical protein